MNTYSVTVEAFDRIRVMNIEAQSCAEAIRKGRQACGIKVDVRVNQRAMTPSPVNAAMRLADVTDRDLRSLAFEDGWSAAKRECLADISGLLRERGVEDDQREGVDHLFEIVKEVLGQ